jgi:hypothetical protein
MSFSCLTFKKNAYAVKILPSKESWNCYHPEDFWNAMCQRSHYTGVRNPGIVTARRTFGMRCTNTRTTRELGIWKSLPSGRLMECDVPTLALHGDYVWNYHHKDKESTGRMGFRRELPAYRRGIHPRKGIPPGITSLFTQIQAGKIKMRGKPFER